MSLFLIEHRGNGLAEKAAALPGVLNLETRHDEGSYMQQGNNGIRDHILCKVCRSAKRNILFIPCKHVEVCETCAEILPICNKCDKEIVDKRKVYIP